MYLCCCWCCFCCCWFYVICGKYDQCHWGLLKTYFSNCHGSELNDGENFSCIIKICHKRSDFDAKRILPWLTLFYQSITHAIFVWYIMYMETMGRLESPDMYLYVFFSVWNVKMRKIQPNVVEKRNCFKYKMGGPKGVVMFALFFTIYTFYIAAKCQTVKYKLFYHVVNIVTIEISSFG